MEDGDELSASKDVEVLQKGARFSVTVLCVEDEDGGIYTCFAYNESGHASCQAQLTVEEGEVVSIFNTHSMLTGTLLRVCTYD